MLSSDPLERWTAAMLDGDFERAWRETDRIELGRRVQRDGSHLLWDGAPFDNKTVLVRCCHGLGDTIQFLRYLPWLRRSARYVRVALQPELRDLFTTACGVDTLTGASDSPCDVEIECMELPYAFRTLVQTIPSDVPYLSGEHIRRAREGFDIRRSPGHLNAGLIWAAGEWNPARSLRLQQFAPLAAIPGVVLHSLQQGPAVAELRFAPFEVRPLSARTGDIVTAAAAMLQLDLIVTVDTVTAHLAGALGRPVWTLLPYEPDWRWMRDREDSPWYPTMQLFRQPAVGDWDSAVHQLVSELTRYRVRPG